MRISDWSSDVCSSDLAVAAHGVGADLEADPRGLRRHQDRAVEGEAGDQLRLRRREVLAEQRAHGVADEVRRRDAAGADEIIQRLAERHEAGPTRPQGKSGNTTWRERVCPYG